MTLILGVEDPTAGRSFLFGDSGIWRQGDAKALLVTHKIWRAGYWIMGASGGWEMAQAVRRMPPPDPLTACENEEALTDLLLAWQEKLYRRLTEITSLFHGVDSTMTGSTPTIIAASGPFVFRMQDMCVVRTANGYGTGGAWMYAEGAVAALQGFAPPIEMGKLELGQRAMVAVAGVTDSVRGPFNWLCTDGTGGGF